MIKSCIFIPILLFYFCCSAAYAATNNDLDPDRQQLSSLGLDGVAINTTYKCFDRWQSFDDWMDFLREKNGWFKSLILSFVFDEDEYNRFEAELDCYVIEYDSNGALVTGYLVVPKARKPDQKFRTILFNRGGNQRYGAITFTHLFSFIFPFASNGNAVFASQYRGIYEETRAQYSDEFGGKDVDDVIRLGELALQVPWVDEKRLFMVGQSRGAMMTYMAARRHKLPIKAIATMGSLVDLRAEMEFRPNMEKVYKKLIPDYQNQKEQALSQRSAIEWVNDLPDIPILLQHGEKDNRVNLAQVQAFDKKLAQARRTHKLIVYEGANHGLRGAREESIKDVLAWFDQAEAERILTGTK